MRAPRRNHGHDSHDGRDLVVRAGRAVRYVPFAVKGGGRRMIRSAVVAATIAAGVLASGVASAGPQPFDYSPTSGPVGTLITASGGPPTSECFGLIRIRLEQLNGDLAGPGTENGTGLFHPSGSWTVQIDIPEGIGIQPGDYQLRVTCSDPGTSFGPVPFTVTAPAPPTEPEAPAVPAAAEPVPAQPLVAPPVFTG
jgi:hypothetical protein